jgi:hypothetical protein
LVGTYEAHAMTEKLCTRCGVTYPATEEHFKRDTKRDKLYSPCRVCRRAITAEWKAGNREREKEQRRDYRRRPEPRAKDRERSRRYYRENHARQLAIRAAKRAARTPEERAKVCADSRAYYEANRERHDARRRAWNARNREKVRTLNRMYASIRRGAKFGAAGSVTPEQMDARLAFYGWRCWMCRAPMQCIDHVIPFARGGTNWPANIRPACTACNSRKHARDHRHFVQTA